MGEEKQGMGNSDMISAPYLFSMEGEDMNRKKGVAAMRRFESVLMLMVI